MQHFQQLSMAFLTSRRLGTLLALRGHEAYTEFENLERPFGVETPQRRAGVP